MTTFKEKRWAIVHKEGFLMGKYNWWKSARKDDIRVPTFRTRDEARRKKRELGEYNQPFTKVVPVTVEITVLSEE